jgi:hypothetical protein
MTKIRRLILHIGMYKTGTTALQMHLTSIRDNLLKKSILYPLSGVPARPNIRFGQHDVAVAAQQATYAPDEPSPVLERLSEEIASSSASTVIISSEMLCSLQEPGILRRYVDSDAVQIYVALRPQDEFVNAMYYTTLMEEKHNLTPQEYGEGPVKSILNYHTIVSRWATAFPHANLSVRIYEKGRSPRSDSIGDFLKVTNLAEQVPAPRERLIAHRTLPARVTTALRTLSKTGIAPEHFFSIFTAAHRIYRNANEETSVYSPSERRSLIEQYRASNRKVRRDFYDGADRDLFAENPLGSDAEWADRVGSEASALSSFLRDMSQFINRQPTGRPAR